MSDTTKKNNDDYSKITVGFYASLLVLCNFNYGYSVSYTSAAKVAMLDSNVLQEQYVTVYSSLIQVGALIGSVVGGFYLIDMYGRNLTLRLSAFGFTFGFLLSTIVFSESVMRFNAFFITLLLIGRCLIGVGLGLCAACVNVYLNELLIPSLKSFFCSLPPIMVNSAVSMAYFLAFGVYAVDLKAYKTHLQNPNANKQFRFTTTMVALPLIGLIMGIVQLIITFIIPESPIWLRNKYKNKELVKHKIEQFTLKFYKNKSLSHYFLQDNSNEKKRTTKDLFKLLLKRSNIKKLTTIVFLMTFSNLVGIYGFMFNLNEIFNTAFKVDENSQFPECDKIRQTNLNAVIVGATSIVSAILSVYVSEKLSRKVVGVFGSVLLAVPLLILGCYFLFTWQYTSIPIICVVLYFIGYSFTWSYLPWVIVTEFSVGPVAGMMMGLASICNWVSSFLVTVIYDPMKNSIGIGGVFIFYAVCCIISAALIYLFVPETNNKPIDEIDAIYESNQIFCCSLSCVN